VGGKQPVQSGEPVELAVDTSELHFFEPGTGLALDRGRRAPQLA